MLKLDFQQWQNTQMCSRTLYYFFENYNWDIITDGLRWARGGTMAGRWHSPSRWRSLSPKRAAVVPMWRHCFRKHPPPSPSLPPPPPQCRRRSPAADYTIQHGVVRDGGSSSRPARRLQPRQAKRGEKSAIQPSGCCITRGFLAL